MDISSLNMVPRGQDPRRSATEATDDQRLFLDVATNGTFGSGGGVSAIRPGDLSPVDTFRGHLAVAIKNGDTQAVEDLLKAPPEGFDINGALGDGGATALHDAVAAGNGDIVRFLVDQKGSDMAKLDDGGKSAYQAADDKAKETNDPKDRDTADYLRGRMTDELKRAAVDGNYNRADELIKAGADASILPGGKLGAREQFIKPGANFSYLLRDAITKGDTQGAMALVKDPPKGWDVNTIGTAFGPAGSDGNSSLLQYVAHATNASNEGTIRALIDQGGADLAKLDPSGKSAFQVLDEYAKATHEPAAQRSADFMRDKMNGELGTAVGNGDHKRVEELLKAGADPEAELAPHSGVTYLAYAAGNSDPATVKALLNAIPEKDRKSFINGSTFNGDTALHAAANAGDYTTYNYLKDAGADETIKDKDGLTPKDMLSGIEPRGNKGSKGAVPGDGRNRNIAAEFLRQTLGTGAGSMPFMNRPDRAAGPAGPAQGTPEQEANDYAARIGQALGQGPLQFQQNLTDGSLYVRLGNITIGSVPYGENPPGADQLHNGGHRTGSLQDQQSFILDRLKDLATMANTPSGRTLLNDLLSAPHPGTNGQVFIVPPVVRTGNTNGSDTTGMLPFTSGPGQGATYVTVTGNGRGVLAQGNPDWANREGMPNDVILFHELAHALSTQSNPNGTGPSGPDPNGTTNNVRNEEARITGLGPYAHRSLSENTYRLDRGLPLRTFYNNPNELRTGRDGEQIWGNLDDWWNHPGPQG